MINKIKNYLIGYVNYIVYEPKASYCDIASVIAGLYEHNNEKRTLIDSFFNTLIIFLTVFFFTALSSLLVNLMIFLEIAIPILSLFILSLVVTLILRALTK